MHTMNTRSLHYSCPNNLQITLHICVYFYAQNQLLLIDLVVIDLLIEILIENKGDPDHKTCLCHPMATFLKFKTLG